jgi:hypothetical protein
MAETVFDNVYLRGTLAVVGVLTAGVLAATTISATSGTFTRLNATTGTAGTLEIRPSAGSGVLTIKSAGGTNSGAFLCISDSAGALNVCALSGGILDCNNFSAKSALCS